MSSEETRHDIVIIGCGMAGMTAAKVAAEAGCKVAALESMLYGGLITNINELDGEIAGSGAEVAAMLMSDLMDRGVEQLSAQAEGIERAGDDLVVTSDAGRHFCRAVVVASGARLKPLGVPGEAELENKGVSHCADCDGPLFQGESVIVIGGGDSALQEAVALAAHCGEVNLVHRDAEFSGQAHLAEAVRAEPKIRIHWNSRVEAVLGTEAVTGVRIAGVDDGASKELPVAGVFAYVGLAPVSDFLPAAVERDGAGFIVTDDTLATSMAGVLAAGAVRAGHGGLLSDAIREGERAGERAVALAAARLAA